MKYNNDMTIEPDDVLELLILKQLKITNSISEEVLINIILKHPELEYSDLDTAKNYLKIALGNLVLKKEVEVAEISKDKRLIINITKKGYKRLSKTKSEQKEITKDEMLDQLTNIYSESKNNAEKVEAFDRKFDVIEEIIEKKFSTIEQIGNEVERIRDELKKVQSEFYGKIIQIFSIFVAIFAFIIVGFTQIPHVVSVEKEWLHNLGNASAVFIPIVLCIIILLFFVNRIIKKTIG